MIPEVVGQMAYEVIGNHSTVTMAAETGQLQLKAVELIIVDSPHESAFYLEVLCRTLTATASGALPRRPECCASP